MKIFKLVYALTGVILGVSLLLVSIRGLPEKDFELYKKACSLENEGETDICGSKDCTCTFGSFCSIYSCTANGQLQK